uniref:t-SNARE coiled-coil homology domain-containing protein n=1 Tax=Romanomermis culicivorax TaxID=13658 RepID=A0A915KXL4_ROMCU
MDMSDSDEADFTEWKKAEMALKKFDQTSKVHLEILNNHRKNMSKLRLSEETSDIWREKCNSDRTIRQLVGDVNQIMTVAAFNFHNDVYMERFKEIILPVKSRIDKEIAEFLDECNRCPTNVAYSAPGSTVSSPGPGLDFPPFGARPLKTSTFDTIAGSIYNIILAYNMFAVSGDLNLQEKGDEHSGVSYDEQLKHLTSSSNASLMEAIEELEQNAAAHKQLMHDIDELNECMHEIAKLVSSQHEVVDRVELNVENASHNVRRGETILQQVAKNKELLGGALVGALIGGPAGFAIGMKAALAAAVTGSAIGAFSSRLISRKIYKYEMAQSTSYPKID